MEVIPSLFFSIAFYHLASLLLRHCEKPVAPCIKAWIIQPFSDDEVGSGVTNSRIESRIQLTRGTRNLPPLPTWDRMLLKYILANRHVMCSVRVQAMGIWESRAPIIVEARNREIQWKYEIHQRINIQIIQFIHKLFTLALPPFRHSFFLWDSILG